MTLRKDLILRVQKIKIFWNHYLSWFYVQQKTKSFIQVYKRNSESLSNIVNLANLAVEEGDKEMAIIFFVLANTKDLDLLVQAHAYLIRKK
jgi:hypothetical protein